MFSLAWAPHKCLVCATHLLIDLIVGMSLMSTIEKREFLTIIALTFTMVVTKGHTNFSMDLLNWDNQKKTSFKKNMYKGYFVTPKPCQLVEKALVRVPVVVLMTLEAWLATVRHRRSSIPNRLVVPYARWWYSDWALQAIQPTQRHWATKPWCIENYTFQKDCTYVTATSLWNNWKM